ncbi:helix-turn-helix domain-containing protein [Streptomyces massasporeus]|uniref:helix-turn-helix domain-containing protein n=1 Tax=Streptomyces massasporeus TaxID=67324 RepID=UPI003808292C
MNTLTAWAQANPIVTVGAALLLLAAITLPLLRSRRASTTERTPAAVIVAALGALACTAYSGDTSWRFAEHRLDMTSLEERAALFLAAELALFACALMARQNLRDHGVPGVPGTLVWFITGVQVIPAYSESGIVGGTVRAVVGPVLAALLWHLAMGIELRHARPDATSASLPALLTRELRERLLSRLGLAVRDRTAEQITRDRWTVKAVELAARLADMKPDARGRNRVARRLSKAVGKAQAGASDEQRAKLLDLLAARRHASALALIDLPSPWQDAPEDAQDTQDAPASASVPPFPIPVPPGTRLLPLIARPALAAPTEQDAQDAPEDDQDADDGPPPEPPLMTSADVANHYGIKTSTVRNWVAAGRIPVHTKDATGRNLFHPNDLPPFHVGVPV